ncbi:MAG: alpha-glucan family phosphorylase [Elusimicrobia bacterium]|nr:alpha-glucan family phosphorylase [Elusimicrobiota bacterium]
MAESAAQTPGGNPAQPSQRKGEQAGGASIYLPQRIAGLKDIACNLWWSWYPAARGLFKYIDRTLWRNTNHNPVKLLALCRPGRLDAVAKDPTFLQWYDAVVGDFDRYMSPEKTWFKTAHPARKEVVAYLSAEFGVHNSLPIYSGGLGVLTGDHCKAASDLGVPLVGVGFMYPQGYVKQRIGIEGWQQNYFEFIDWSTSPVMPARLPDGARCVLRLSLGTWPLHIGVWNVQVGRVPLFLMDTNVEGNDAADREISGRLYGGDRIMRLRQEIVLGIGGVRILQALGVDAQIFHANEGHAAFLMIERIYELIQQGKTFEEARKTVAETTVFTTHTPVPAGHDVFPEELVAEYFRSYWQAFGLDQDQFLRLGRTPGASGWNMTALALRLAGRRNGVSRRNGQVCRQMWQPLWPDKSVDDVPITHVTNGVHLATWVKQTVASMYDHHLGKEWRERQDDRLFWRKVHHIPDEEFWNIHMRAKRELINLVRQSIRERWMRDRIDATQVIAGGALLDPEALTIGFARRFAGYKRATLIFRDIERLKKTLMDPWRPVQILFAGKAHPADENGKRIIQQVYQLARDVGFGGHIAFIEDYDMHKARYFVQGCDLWLNNPLFPMEACGTSGQKAAVNGVPSLSVLDGWWEEGYNRENGWAPPEASDLPPEKHDEVDAKALYDLLEEKIVPLFFDRAPNDVPVGWVRIMKEAVASSAPLFCANRMVKEYVDRLYFPAPEPQAVPSGAEALEPPTPT